MNLNPLNLTVYLGKFAHQENVFEIRSINDDDGDETTFHDEMVDGSFLINEEYDPDDGIYDKRKEPKSFNEIIEKRIQSIIVKNVEVKFASWNIGSDGGRPCSNEKIKVLLDYGIWHILEEYHIVAIQEVTKDAYEYFKSDLIEEWSISDLSKDSFVLWKSSFVGGKDFASHITRCATVQFSTIFGELFANSIHAPHRGSPRTNVLHQMAQFVNSKDFSISGGDYNANQTTLKQFFSDKFQLAIPNNIKTNMKNTSSIDNIISPVDMPLTIRNTGRVEVKKMEFINKLIREEGLESMSDSQLEKHIPNHNLIQATFRLDPKWSDLLIQIEIDFEEDEDD